MQPISPRVATRDQASARPSARVVSPHRPLPAPRAVVGALLVTIAALGTFAVASGITGDGREPVVVGARDLTAGARLEVGDLRVERMALASGTRRAVATTREQLAGLTLLGPVRDGELIQNGAVVEKQGGPDQPEVSFTVPAGRALGGKLRSGETVDVLTSDGKTDAQPARAAVRDARVVRVERAGGALDGAGELTIVLAVNSRNDAAALAGAVDHGDVTVVRTTGASADPAPGLDPTVFPEPVPTAPAGS